jgi:hypothetical protein
VAHAAVVLPGRSLGEEELATDGAAMDTDENANLKFEISNLHFASVRSSVFIGG